MCVHLFIHICMYIYIRACVHTCMNIYIGVFIYNIFKTIRKSILDKVCCTCICAIAQSRKCQRNCTISWVSWVSFFFFFGQSLLYMHIRNCEIMCTNAYTCMCIYMHVQIHVCVCMCVCVCVCVCVCKYIYIYIYIYIYTYTYMHIYIYTYKCMYLVFYDQDEICCGVASVSRIDKIIGLFCKRDL